MSSSEEQLINFFAYSVCVYPVTNYLISSKRSYNKVSRWRGAIYAMFFLGFIATCHLLYEINEEGPNYYQMLSVSRHTTTAALKKAYRHLSLELHPDKNRSPTAVDEFRKVKQAFDVLSSADMRREYDRLGNEGVRVAAQSVIDHKYVIMQLLFYYASSLIFAFLMTFSEQSGDAMTACVFVLVGMLLVETALVLHERKLPTWFMSTHTSHDVVVWLHRLFPAFMNGCRCIIGSLTADRKTMYVDALTGLSSSASIMTKKLVLCAKQLHKTVEYTRTCVGGGRDHGRAELGVVAGALQGVEWRGEDDGLVEGVVAASLKSINDPMHSRSAAKRWAAPLLLVRNIILYLGIRYLIEMRNRAKAEL